MTGKNYSNNNMTNICFLFFRLISRFRECNLTLQKIANVQIMLFYQNVLIYILKYNSIKVVNFLIDCNIFHICILANSSIFCQF